MLLRVYSVFDSKASAFYPPFFTPTEGVAVRSLTELANDPGHPFGRHPADYTLFFIGTFDDSDGRLEWTPPQAVCPVVKLVVEETRLPLEG